MRLWLTEVIGKPVTAVAYPGGGKDQYSPRLMQEAGYTTAYTTDDGVNSYGKPSRYLLKRYNAGARGLSWGSWLAIFRVGIHPVWAVIQVCLIIGSIFFATGLLGEQVAGQRAEIRELRRQLDAMRSSQEADVPVDEEV
jgi:hypothetical protein